MSRCKLDEYVFRLLSILTIDKSEQVCYNLIEQSFLAHNYYFTYKGDIKMKHNDFEKLTSTLNKEERTDFIRYLLNLCALPRENANNPPPASAVPAANSDKE